MQARLDLLGCRLIHLCFFARDRKLIGFSVGVKIDVVCLRRPKTTCFSVAIGGIDVFVCERN